MRAEWEVYMGVRPITSRPRYAVPGHDNVLSHDTNTGYSFQLDPKMYLPVYKKKYKRKKEISKK
jgi:hypothetical protein